MKRHFRTLILGSAFAAIMAAGAPVFAQGGPEFYVQQGGAAAGPFGIDALPERIRAGALTPETLVWSDGLTGWMPAGEIEALAALFAPPPPLGTPEIALPRGAYYVDLGSAQGPFDGAALLQLVREKKLTGETLVWAEGMANWGPAGQVEDLRGVLMTAMSGPPPLPTKPKDSPPPLPPSTPASEPKLPPPPDVTRVPPPPDVASVPPPPDVASVPPPTPATQPRTPPDVRVPDILSDPRLERMTVMEREDLGVVPTDRLHDGPMHGPTPSSIPGGQVITTKGLIELTRSGVTHLIFHVLGSEQAIPGAYFAVPASAPGNFQDETQKILGNYLERGTNGNRATPLVFYCLSRECWMSYNASLRAINLGYTNVLWYRGGIEAWQSLGLDTKPPIQ